MHVNKLCFNSPNLHLIIFVAGEQLTTASNHAMVEVAEYKAKLRKLRQQLEEKTEQWSETREELERVQEISDKLKTENLELCQDARAAKTYRDELDVLRERAEKVINEFKDDHNLQFFYKEPSASSKYPHT